MPIDLNSLEEDLMTLGLRLRGVLNLDADEATSLPLHNALPEESRSNSVSLLVVGNIGSELWITDARAYPKTEAQRTAAGNDALNDWTRKTIDPIAKRLGGVALYPFDGPPWHPFQQWAMRTEAVTPSPIGMLIHPDFGLWHAYRAAIAVPEYVEPPPHDDRESPCLSCKDQPCLNTCPVDAFVDMRGPEGRYDVPSCAAHIATDDGNDCLTLGCRARRACPVAPDHVYAPGQAEFHMQAFLRSRG